jgi:hypothetical protein
VDRAWADAIEREAQESERRDHRAQRKSAIGTRTTLVDEVAYVVVW